LFQGEFNNDKILKGVVSYRNKDVYEGEFSQDLRHGYGKFTEKQRNAFYEGFW